MNYLITGGAGFIGFNLASVLSDDTRNKIVIFDNLSKQSLDDDFKKILKRKNIKFIKGDLKNISKTIKSKNFDYIYHLAAILGVQKVIQKPYSTLIENIISTKEVIEYAKKQKSLKKICFTSTSEVYAKTLELGLTKYPTPEKVDFLIKGDFNERSSYALSKIVGEYLFNYSGLKFVIFRPHNIFGARMGFAHVIPQLVKKFLDKKKNFISVDNPNHKRTFCYIDYAIELIIKISHNKNTSRQIYNIGAPRKVIAISELAKQIKNILKSNKKITFTKVINKDHSPKKRKPDMNKSKFFLNRTHNLKQGLFSTVKWYENYYLN
jgi:nucleoside-diphosphate-sugar epimerase